MRHRLNCEFRRFLATRQDTKQNFRHEEDGGLSIMSLFSIPIMLILGGMAVDFMRFESERTLIQDTADRAALAAANLEFTNPGEGVAKVQDFFEKAGLEQYLDGDAIITETVNNRTVEVNVLRPMDTFFLGLAGVGQLDASAQSIATQGVGNVEISLVLDISGSMDDPTYDQDGVETGQTKMEALKVAATSFIETALQDSNTDRVSISLVPYSMHVNPGKAIFDRMSTNQRHGYSHCIEFEDSDFSNAGLDLNNQYEQGQHFDIFTSSSSSLLKPSCPTNSYETITAISQDKDELLAQINQLEPTLQTSIHLGMKWGLALLDPSSAPLVADDVDAAFAGRPAAYYGDSEDYTTRKVIVVMTDGENTSKYELKDEFYETDVQVAHWAANPLQYWFKNNVHSGYTSLSNFYQIGYNNSSANDMLEDSCNVARDNNVQVFSIAFEAPDDGVQVMSECATSANHFFNTNGDDLNSVFLAIAEQVTDLRLTQ